MANEIVTEIILDLDKLKQKLKEAQGSGEEGGKQFGKGFGDGAEKGMESAFSGIKGKLLGLVAAIGGAFTLRAVIGAAGQAEAAVNSFNSSLAAAGNFSDAASARFQAFAESMQNITTVEGDAIVQNAALLASVGRLSGEGLERATKAALDLSAGMNIDLQTAFSVVAKAASGNTSALSRYGIKIQETGDVTRDFQAALLRLNQTFGGTAEAKVNTFEGALAQLWNRFGDLLKVVGRWITTSPMVIDAIKDVSAFFLDFTKKVSEFLKKNPIESVTLSLIRMAQSVVQFVLPVIELLFNLSVAGFNAMASGANLLVAFLAKIAEGWLRIAGLVSPSMAKLAEDVRLFAADAATTGEEFAQKTATSFSDAFNFGFTAKTQEFLDSTQTFVQGFADKIGTMPGTFKNAADQISDEARRLAETLNKIIGQTAPKVVSAGIQSLGASLVIGAKAFGNFRTTALNLIGDMSIHMGEAMIAQAGLFAAFASLVKNPFTAPAALVAFGVALIGLGAVLKAAAGGGGAGGGGAGAAVGGGVGAGGEGGLAATEAGTLQEVQRAEPSTNVTVNVQGNILDRRESGLAIADIINETFGSNGIVFATGAT
jgi:hypothetical protein